MLTPATGSTRRRAWGSPIATRRQGCPGLRPFGWTLNGPRAIGSLRLRGGCTTTKLSGCEGGCERTLRTLPGALHDSDRTRQLSDHAHQLQKRQLFAMDRHRPTRERPGDDATRTGQSRAGGWIGSTTKEAGGLWTHGRTESLGKAGNPGSPGRALRADTASNRVVFDRRKPLEGAGKRGWAEQRVSACSFRLTQLSRALRQYGQCWVTW